MLLLGTNKQPLMFLRPRNVDKRILEQGLGLYEGFHVSATLADFMTNFIRDLGKPFFVDPMVYVFTLRPVQLLDDSTKTLKPCINVIARQYGSLFEQSAGKRPITPTDLLSNHSSLESITKNVLSYQKSKFAGQLSLISPYYDKYALWGEEISLSIGTSSSTPEVLIPPYFPFKNPTNSWYTVTLECARKALSLKERNDYIFPALLIAPQMLTDPDSLSQIIGDFGSEKFDGFFIWVNDFKEETETPERLNGLVQLIRGLSSGGRPVFKLYGGYFSALLFAYGLKGFSCGLGYGSEKNVFKYGAAGGRIVPKYYVPRLHRSIALGDAERMLRTYPSLRCGCTVCKGVYGDNMDGFMEMRRRGRCESHFLNVRKKELKEIDEKGLNHVFSDMEGTVQAFKGDLLVDVENLKRWRKTIESSTKEIL